MGVSPLLDRLLRIARLLGSRRARLVTLLVTALLSLASVGARFVLDDNTHALLQRRSPGLVGHVHAPLDLFVFANGDPATIRAMVDEGVLAWWTADSFLNAFFRPLSSLTHVLDGWLWPTSAAMMHVHTIVWYLLLTAAVGLLYRRIAQVPWVAGLGLLLYAVDDAHGFTIGWNANRNAVVASVLAVLALVCHDRWRRDGHWPSGALGAAALGAGLLAGEVAACAAGYLVAYALLLDRTPRRARLASLVPYAALIATWRVAYVALGYGSRGSDAYLDPGGEPLAFLAALPARLGLLLMGQFGAPPADLGFWGPADQRWMLALPAAATIGALAAVAWPVIRAEREARFWAAGAVLSAVPLCASFSSDRHLLMVGVGGMGLLATVLARPLLRPETYGRGRHLLLGGFALLHLVVAPLLFPLRARTWEVLGSALDRADASLPSDASIRDKTVVIVNAPIEPFASWLHVMRARRGIPRPAHLYALAVASSRLAVTRTADRELVVVPERGYFSSEPERLVRSRRLRFRAGDRVVLSTMTAHIGPLNAAGLPSSVRFRFDRPLDSHEYVWVAWDSGRYRRIDLPPVGATLSFPAVDLMAILGNALP